MGPALTALWEWTRDGRCFSLSSSLYKLCLLSKWINLWSFIYFFIFIWKADRELLHPLAHSLKPQQPGLCQAEGRSLEINLGLPRGVRIPDTTLPLGVGINRILHAEGTPVWMRSLNSTNCCARCPPRRHAKIKMYTNTTTVPWAAKFHFILYFYLYFILYSHSIALPILDLKASDKL